MPKGLSVAELFQQAGLVPCGPVRWGTPLPESGAGVYVVALVPDASAQLERPVYAEYLDERVRRRWLSEQPIIYVGQTTNQTLVMRVNQFYRHRYGQRAPHRGGEVVTLVQCDRWVYWSRAAHPRDSERIMISAFKRLAGQTPFANRP